MDLQTSPNKRRVLAPIDANTKSPAAATARPATSPSKPRLLKPLTAPRAQGLGTKRPFEEDPDRQRGGSLGRPQQEQSRPFKKATRPTLPTPQNNAMPIDTTDDESADCGGLNSPANSSTFDHSFHDTSTATVITEPETTAAASAVPFLAISRPRAMTREETRQKAELLRLRLGLASYKVRTGQTDVPLEQLQVRPLSGWSSSASSIVRPSAPDSSSHAQPESVDGLGARNDEVEERILDHEGGTDSHDGTRAAPGACKPLSPHARQSPPPTSASTHQTQASSSSLPTKRDNQKPTS